MAVYMGGSGAAPCDAWPQETPRPRPPTILGVKVGVEPWSSQEMERPRASARRFHLSRAASPPPRNCPAGERGTALPGHSILTLAEAALLRSVRGAIGRSGQAFSDASVNPKAAGASPSPTPAEGTAVGAGGPGAGEGAPVLATLPVSGGRLGSAGGPPLSRRLVSRPLRSARPHLPSTCPSDQTGQSTFEGSAHLELPR